MKKIISAGLAATLSVGLVMAVKNDAPVPKAPEVRPFITKEAAPARQASVKLASAPNKAKAKDVPFIEDFSSASTLNDWFIQDVNNDGDSWEYDANNQLLKCYFSSKGYANNDWVITPPINLGADDIYTLSFSYGSQGTRFAPEHLTVTMGKSEYGTQHTVVLFDDANIQNFWNGSMITETITLPVEEDGAYYFGFHSTSPKSAYCLYLDDVKVEQNGSYAAPEAVGNLTVTPGAEGALSAEVSLISPSLTAEGNPITSNLDDISVYRDGTLVYSFDAPVGGAELSFTDTGMTSGEHTYMAIASLNGLEGAKAETTVYIGVDTPNPVLNVKAVDNGNSVTLTWDAPTGLHGGYVGDKAVTYTITRVAGETESTVANRYTSLSYTDSTLPTDVQNHVFYEVTASTSAGSADASTSNSVFFGPAYSLPFAESFAFCELKKSPWIMEYINAGWFTSSWYLVAMGTNPLCPPIDGDDGMALFQASSGSMNLYQGNEIRLATPAIDLSGSTSPFVSFYLFHYDTSEISYEYDEEAGETVAKTTTYNDKIRLQVSVDNGEYIDVPETEIMLAANNNGWTKYTFPLDAYKNASKLSLGLVGYADGGGNICIDNLVITDNYASDLEVTGLFGPQSVKEGETAEYTCNIINNGIASTKDYTVSLILDDEVVDTQKGQGAAIFANGGEKTIKLTFTPRHQDTGCTHKLYAQINFAVDECPANDISDVIELEVPANDMPRVETLTGTADTDGVSIELTWVEPDMTNVVSVVRDDVEAYNPFIINNIGSFYLIDNDKSATYGIDGISFENSGASMAWQVFNPSLTTVDLDLNFNQKWRARSGNQYLISWGAYEVSSNDDWLISPLLSGEEQTVSFYIKSVSLAYNERFRVLYSTDGRTMSDFVKVGEPNYYTPSSKWRKFSVKLPAGAKYFAIQNISADGWGIFVDDITYVPADAKSVAYDFKGYNVYRDGNKINQSPVAEPVYVDTPGDSEPHSYTVTALYSQGESSPSPAWVNYGLGVDAPQATSVIVRGLPGQIEINGYEGEATVYSVDGRVIASGDVDGRRVFDVASGLYVVVCGDTHAKVLVK